MNNKFSELREKNILLANNIKKINSKYFKFIKKLKLLAIKKEISSANKNWKKFNSKTLIVENNIKINNKIPDNLLKSLKSFNLIKY